MARKAYRLIEPVGLISFEIGGEEGLVAAFFGTYPQCMLHHHGADASPLPSRSDCHSFNYRRGSTKMAKVVHDEQGEGADDLSIADRHIEVVVRIPGDSFEEILRLYAQPDLAVIQVRLCIEAEDAREVGGVC